MIRTLLTVFFSVAVAAQANNITVNFDAASLVGLPGTTLYVTGTLTNDTDNTIYIKSDSFTFAITGALNDSVFLTDAPASLAPDATSSDFELFTIAIPPAQAPGGYDGVFSVMGGSTPSAFENQGSNPFMDGVEAPEPSSFLLCAAGIAILWRRRRSA
jgi:hypothetical protein